MAAPSPKVPEPSSTRSQHTIELRIGRTLGILLTILAAAAVAALAWQVLAHFSHLLLVVLLAVLVAFVFAPMVGRLERQGLPRIAAIALSYLGTLVVVAGLLVLFLGPLVTQIGALIGQLPKEVATVQTRLAGIDHFFIQHGLPLRVATMQKQVLDQAQTIGTALLGSTLVVLGSLTSFVVDLFLVLVLSFYFLLDTSTIHNNLIRLLPERRRTQAFFVEAAFVKVVGGYIRGQLLMALTIGVAAGLGCWLLGVPYPLVIGLLAGLFELMPMVGPVLGAIPAVLISLTQSFSLVLWVIVLFILIQQIESNVIGPRITGHAVGLHPLGAMLALLAGVEMGGVVGALFAVPATGVLYVLAVAVYWQWQGQMIPTSSPRPPSRMVGLAREVVRRRTTAATMSPSRTGEPAESIEATTATATTAGADTGGRPESLASLDREVDHLRERFEQAESERQAEEEARIVRQAETTKTK